MTTATTTTRLDTSTDLAEILNKLEAMADIAIELRALLAGRRGAPAKATIPAPTIPSIEPKPPASANLRWRQRNREHCNAYQRDYMAKRRAEAKQEQAAVDKFRDLTGVRRMRQFRLSNQDAAIWRAAIAEATTAEEAHAAYAVAWICRLPLPAK